MSTIYNLPATRQKSYYGKAKVIEDGAEKSLKSYETSVCKIDESGDFKRLWGGYSRTTINHVNDFRRLFGLPALSKKEWEALPCGNDSGEKFKCEFSNGFVSWTSEVVFDDEYDAWDFAESVAAARNYSICFGVIPA